MGRTNPRWWRDRWWAEKLLPWRSTFGEWGRVVGYQAASVRRKTLLSLEAFGSDGVSGVVWWGETVVRQMMVGDAAVQSVVLPGESMR